MSTANPLPEPDQHQQTLELTEPSRATAPRQKSQRVLACALCRRRKIKCDHKFPCANCVRAGAQCTPANAFSAHQRRPRLPERELLERLRLYEGLLRQNGVGFEPWVTSGPSVAEHASPSEDGRASSDSRDGVHSESIRGDKIGSHEPHAALDLWRAISRATLDQEDDDEEGEDVNEADGDTEADSDGDEISGTASLHGSRRGRYHSPRVANKAWTHRFQAEVDDQCNDHLLFGPPKENIDLSLSHPEQVHMFRLWQIYLDNVNPLLKVTHTPTLQSRIIDAASDVTNIAPSLEALMFAIYCTSVVSVAEEDCVTFFRSPRKDLLARYQFACQQALRKCGAWRSPDLDGLTALYLYLVSVRPQTDVRALSSMLAVAIRVAQRMGMHSESSYTGHTVLEAEMRRRLWWSLVYFDHRICEVADYRTTTLTPVWDCKTPLNASDFELRADMKNLPTAHDKPTEALFAVVRSEVANFVRYSSFHLNFVNPSLNAIAQLKHCRPNPTPETGELLALEKLIEDKYLAFCNPEDPLHYMTIWTTRGFLAKNRLLEHYSKHSTPSGRPTDAQRAAALASALTMLECDTNLRTSPLTKPYLWLVDFHPPAMGYLHILNDLRKRPADDTHAASAWGALADNYEALAARLRHHHAGGEQQGVYRILLVFSRVILQAWDAREALLLAAGGGLDNGEVEQPPRLVADIRRRMAQVGLTPASRPGGEGDQVDSEMGMYDVQGSAMGAMPMDLGGQPLGGGGGRQGFPGGPPGLGGGFQFSDVPGQAVTDADMDVFWGQMDRGWLSGAQGW